MTTLSLYSSSISFLNPLSLNIILFLIGLRIGEARGLQWKDINWDNKTLWINKQVQSLDNYSSSYYVCNLKTASSNRILTMCDALYDDFKKVLR